ncbi:MAG: FtsW/RodA/SpoVE family cell cycle protein [Bacteroidota bacterium]|jgi:cell division protein FtsW
MNWIQRNIVLKGDKTIWLIVLLLSIVSLLAVYSSTGLLAFKKVSGNTEHFLFKHFIVLCGGATIMYVTSNLPYTLYAKLARFFYLLSVPLLIFTLFMGTNLNDANRWITLPIIGMTFQTSDFAKIALILFLARQISKNQETIHEWRGTVIPLVVIVILVCGLIFPANFSTAALLFFTSMVIMFIGRVSVKHLAKITGIALIGITLFIAVANITGYEGRIKTWTNRILTFIGKNDKHSDSKNAKVEFSDEDYQAQQAKIAIATGGFFGKGPGNSEQRNFLPHPYSDFIFAIIIEEYGLIGGAFVLILYLLFFYRALLIVKRTEKAFAAMITVGFAFSMVFQALINMGVAVGVFPVTGQTLPLLSMGGSSIIFTSFAFGVILSVSNSIDNNEKSEDLSAIN